MNPEAVQLAIFVLAQAIKEIPGLAADLAALFSKEEPTVEDWKALRAKIQSKSYEDYVRGD